MKSSPEIYTPLISSLLGLNQELRQKLSSMPSYTEQEIRNLEQWLGETETMVENLENAFLLISLHLKSLKIELRERQQKDSLKH